MIRVKSRLKSMAVVLALAFGMLGGASALNPSEAGAGTWRCQWKVACVYKLTWHETNALANWTPSDDEGTNVSLLLGPFRSASLHHPLMWAYRFSARRAVANGNCVAIAPTGMMAPTRC